MGYCGVNLNDDTYRALSEVAVLATEALRNAWKYEIDRAVLQELFDEVDRLKVAVEKEG